MNTNTTTTRKPNTTVSGGAFTDDTKLAVWKKASTSLLFDPAKYRKDACGKVIEWSAYGDTTHRNGWEIDHIKPVSKGGTDDLSNLQALYWATNRSKGDDTSGDYCSKAS